MRTIIYDGGDEVEVSVEIRNEGEDETYKYLNRLCNWLFDASDINNDRGYELTAERIKKIVTQITSALDARGYFDWKGADE